jgi:hypothetical protein
MYSPTLTTDLAYIDMYYKIYTAQQDWMDAHTLIKNELGLPRRCGEKWANITECIVNNAEHEEYGNLFMPIPESMEDQFNGLVERDLTWVS